MWQAYPLVQPQSTALQFQINEKGELLSFAQVIERWQNSAPFRSYFNTLLAEIPFEAFYWEVAPMTKTQTNLPFEFVVINSAPSYKHLLNLSRFLQRREMTLSLKFKPNGQINYYSLRVSI